MEKKEGAKEVKEFEEVKEKSAQVAAFFDVDGTLAARPTLERRFFRMLRYRRAIRAKNYLLWLREGMRLAPRGINAILQANKMHFRGVAVDRSEAGGLTSIPPFFREALDRIAWHARQGHTIVLVSGTLEPLAQMAARALEDELAGRGAAARIRVCATRLEEADGKWTGRVSGEAMFGEAKARAAKRLTEKMRLELGRCFAYGDSGDDRWMLEAVGQPAAVNPSRKLARIARKRGWLILKWQEEKNLTQRAQSTQRPQRDDSDVNRRADETRGNAFGETQEEPWVDRVRMRETRSRSLG